VDLATGKLSQDAITPACLQSGRKFAHFDAFNKSHHMVQPTATHMVYHAEDHNKVHCTISRWM